MGLSLEPRTAAKCGRPHGLVEGIDISRGMLARATGLITRQGWANVSVVAKDAAEVETAECFEAVLFSLSYSVIPNRDLALARAWSSLVEGGRLVIMDACLPEGRRGRWLPARRVDEQGDGARRPGDSSLGRACRPEPTSEHRAEPAGQPHDHEHPETACVKTFHPSRRASPAPAAGRSGNKWDGSGRGTREGYRDVKAAGRDRALQPTPCERPTYGVNSHRHPGTMHAFPCYAPAILVGC